MMVFTWFPSGFTWKHLGMEGGLHDRFLNVETLNIHYSSPV